MQVAVHEDYKQYLPRVVGASFVGEGVVTGVAAVSSSGISSVVTLVSSVVVIVSKNHNNNIFTRNFNHFFYLFYF